MSAIVKWTRRGLFGARRRPAMFPAGSGSYQIAAKFEGVWHSKRIQAGTSGQPAKVSFVWNGK